MTAPTPVHGGFDSSQMHHVLDRACASVGLDSANARLLRGHTNAVILLDTSPVVVKIARRGSRISDVQRTVRFVRWLMDRGFPTVPLHAAGADQPITIDGHPVTFWTYLPQPEDPIRAAQLAAPLRELHSLPLPAFQLAAHDNVRAIRTSIRSITSLPASSLRFLSDRADHLEAELAKIEFFLPEAVIQGDPQHRNALHNGSAPAVLCDWDTVAVGQPEWDLVTVEVHCRRFGYSKYHYQEFAQRYGCDVRQWPGYSTLRDLRELRMVTTNARKTAHAPGSLAEIERRVEGLRNDDTGLLWRIL
ncbi:aminoglycoside phosphotransferase [Streptomyces sp. CB02923]|uniref:phosphotransferase n=1 Tax=Streptomyces sp. CB02923 TaxID=1718985 RepID=UPI000961CC02|nr:phosphotransferase [Streptomyces sp. CB02923]OKI02971.1 aminoglycoside phosphotransferase [Streptomyces sp. CB02923]